MKKLSGKIIFFLKIIGFAFLFSTCLFSQSFIEKLKFHNDNFEERYIIKQYSSREGIPQNSVNDLLIDPNDFLWMATYGGFVLFDGVSFYNFADRPNFIVGSNKFRKIMLDNEGIFYLGEIYGSIASFDGKDAEIINDKIKKVISEKIISFKDFLIDRKDNLWILDRDKVLRISHYKDTPLTIKLWKLEELKVASQFVEFFYDQQKDLLYIVDDTQILEYKEGKFIDKAFIKVKKRINKIAKAFVDKYIVSYDQYFALYDTKFSKIKEVKSVIDIENSINYFFFDNEHNEVLFFCDKGVILLDSNLNQRNLTEKFNDFLPLTKAIKDKSGSIWIGTYRNGLLCLKRKRAKTVLFGDNYINNIYPIIKINDKKLFIGSFGDGIFHINDNKFELLKFSLSPSCFYRIEDYLLVGDSEGGLFKYNLVKNDFAPLNLATSLKNYSIVSILKDDDENLWIGTSKGLLLKQKDKEIFFDKIGEEDWIAVFDIKQANDKTIYFACDKGAIKYQDNKFTKINLPIPNPFIRGINLERDDRIWFCSYGSGVFYFNPKNNDVKQISKKNGLLSDYVHNFINDGKGNYIVPTNEGLFRLQESLINEYIAGKTNYVCGIVYDYRENLLSDEFNGGVNPSFSILEKDSLLLLPTLKGVVSYDLSNMGSVISSNLMIIKILVDGKSISFKNYFELTSLPANIEFYFGSSTSSREIRRLYETKLENWDFNWNSPKTRNFEQYKNLPEGSYRFVVRTIGLDGKYSYAYVDFKIKVGFFESKTFEVILKIAGLSILIFLFATLLIYYRKKFLGSLKQLHIKTLEADDIYAKNIALKNETLKQKSIIDNYHQERIKAAQFVKENLIKPFSFFKATLNMALESCLNEKDFDQTAVFFNSTIKNLLNDMYFLAKIEDDQSDFSMYNRYEIIDLKEIFELCLNSYEIKSKINKEKIYFYYNGNDFNVKGEREKLLFVCSNFILAMIEVANIEKGIIVSLNRSALENAVKFAAEGFDAKFDINKIIDAYQEYINHLNRLSFDKNSVELRLCLSRIYIEEMGGTTKIERKKDNRLEIFFIMPAEGI